MQFLTFIALAATGATAARQLCSGFQTGSTLTSTQIAQVMNANKAKLQLTAGWTNQVSTTCTSTDGRAIKQQGVLFDYGPTRDEKLTVPAGQGDKVICSLTTTWNMKCDKA